MERLEGDIRLAVYESICATAKVPSTRTLAERFGVDEAAIDAALRRLEARHMIVLAPGTTRVWMAHPFSAVPTAYPVRHEGRMYWANCAWDFFAVPLLLRGSGVQTVHCAESGAPLRATFQDGEFLAGEGLVHFAVPPARFWDNVAFT